ncbi:hypothetical protein [Parapedobacter sp. DT-150]|uniref:hypothetical protein n=1 Tax=Parapedobacter sp. DT-150 TaxID=3396162 RepID=UPI003F1C685A
MKKALPICGFMMFVMYVMATQAQDAPTPPNNQNDTTGSNSNTTIKGAKINRGVDTTRTNTYLIEYDFRTGLYNSNNLKIKVNKPVVFKIKNINRLAYKVEITAADSVIGYSDLEGLYELINSEEREQIAQQLQSAESTASPPLATPPPLTSDDTSGLKNGDLLKQINGANASYLKSISEALDSIKNNKEIRFDTLLNKDSVINANFAANLPFHFEVQRELTILYLQLSKLHRQLIEFGETYLYVRTVINSPILPLDSMLAIKAKLDAVHTMFDQHKNIMHDFNIKTRQFQNLYQALKSNPELGKLFNYGGVIKLGYIADHQHTEVVALKEQVDKIGFDKIKGEMMQIHHLLNDNVAGKSIFEYVSNPIQATKDVIVFDVKISKKEKDNSLFYNERQFTHREFTRHGVRLDLSVGVSGSFHSSNYAYDLQYDSLGNKKITKQDKSLFTPSFVGFFTTSYRSSNHWTGGLSIGLGISASEGTFTFDNFFLGGSLIVGKYERASLTSGVSFRNLPTLNKDYRVGQTVSDTYTPDNVTTKSYRPGFFIAISYNITKGVRDNIKQVRSFF